LQLEEHAAADCSNHWLSQPGVCTKQPFNPMPTTLPPLHTRTTSVTFPLQSFDKLRRL